MLEDAAIERPVPRVELHDVALESWVERAALLGRQGRAVVVLDVKVVAIRKPEHEQIAGDGARVHERRTTRAIATIVFG